MIIYIDIDETICHSPNKEYENARPIQYRINEANRLYDMGHTIVYWTARGMSSGIDWRELTERQLDEWGVKRHDLKMGKPSYDLFICDKAINSNEWLATTANL